MPPIRSRSFFEMKSLQKFGLVLWKNWILRKRHFIVTGIEIILPTLLFLILVAINSKVRRYRHFSSEIINYTFYENISLFDRDFYDLSGQTLYVSPNTSAVHRLMTSVQTKVNQLPLRRPFKFVAVENENDFLEIYKTTNESFFAGVDFTSNFLYQLDYRLRFAFSYNYFETDRMTENYFITRPFEGISNYPDTGFLTLQHLIAMSFIESLMTNGSIYSKVKVFSEMFPYPEYETKDSIVELFTIIISQFIMLSFLFTIPTMTKNIVHEKERGVKELMQMMGLPSWLQWFGWFVSNFILMTFSSLIIVILLCAPIGAPIGVIGHSAPELVFLILLLYIASSILFAFFISTLFNKPSVSTAVCILAWMITYYVPYFIMNSNYFKYNSSSKLATSLFPNTCMAWIFRLILDYENRGIGLQWSNLSSPAIRGDSLTVTYLIGMMFVSIFIYGFLTWYIDNVFPGVYGVPKPWYFLLTKSYWFKLETVPEDVGDYPTISSDSFENEPMGLKKGIIIKNLTKNYGWFQTGKLAVDNISLNLFENQITALLGHNGAGKTTTMSVLTGMYPPSKGTAYVNNLDIRTQIDRAREQMGLCPQHNMLFNELTAQEHLEFFAKLKGLRGKQLKAEVETYLNKIQLVEKKNVYAMNLSGGMQRKLHLGMALIGNSRIVVLDEPTSGLDPEARRTVWDLLQEVRPGRTILLTTHVMEEADILGDRIAIMSHGRIKCCGTPMFLKLKYGAGYHLNISKADHCDKTALSALISKFVPDVRLHSDVSAELSYILPSNQTSLFPALFTELENNLISLRISGFGVSVTTMEEVFLKVGELAGEEEMEETSSDSTVRLELFHTEMNKNHRNTGFALLRQQFYGLFTKRVVYNRRRWLLMIFQVLIPVTVVATALSLINLVSYSDDTDFPSLRMDLSPYGNTKVFCKADEMLTTNYVNSLPSGTKAIKVDNVEEALLNLGRTNLRDYRENAVIAGKLFSGTDDVKITAMYNGLFPHSLPTSLNQLHNALLTYYTNIKEASITLVNAPLPKYGTTYRYPDECRILGTIMGIFISFGLSFITSSFAILPIHERTSKSKHLQMMTGVGGPIYWGTIFLWDFMLYFATTLLLILIIFLLDSSEIFTVGNGLGAVFLLLLLYGLSSLPFSYMMSFLFKLPASGFSALTIINILLGITFSLIAFVFDEHPYLNSTGEQLKWIFGLLPSFPVTLGFMLMSKTCSPSDKYWDFQWVSPDIKQMLKMMIGDCILYLFLLCLIESGVLYKVWYRQCSRNKLANLLMTGTVSADSVDSDVVEEQQRIETLLVSGNSLMSDALVIHNLTKKFAALVAVDKLSLGVKNGECFGLLGVNGAGKTTTFRMLTGDELITDGNAYFQGTSLIDKRRQFLKQISYCPQFDALIDFLTGRETLYLFARLRGIAEKQIPTVVNDVISFVGIQEYADKITKVYSGGNKRKLSVGIALIGQPPMIFLDEPTTGVDPLSRRKIWDILTSVRETGTSLVLTSHSMEECEALCSRIAIMVNGQFKCLGAVQHLKNKYGQGFTIIAKIDSKVGPEMASFQENLQQFIERNFHNCTLKDSHQGMVQYHIADTSTRWAHLFQVMEQAKQEFHLEDYSVSQTTLEQVFISFARTQRADPLQVQTVQEIRC